MPGRRYRRREIEFERALGAPERTAAEGGRELGFMLGGLFVALGAARLTLVLRRA